MKTPSDGGHENIYLQRLKIVSLLSFFFVSGTINSNSHLHYVKCRIYYYRIINADVIITGIIINNKEISVL